MLFKEAVSKRIINLCKENNYTVNKLAEMSTVPPTTMRSLISNKVDNPSAYVIYKICKLYNISLKDFFNDDLFNFNNIDD